jgi:hypothetical protein
MAKVLFSTTFFTDITFKNLQLMDINVARGKPDLPAAARSSWSAILRRYSVRIVGLKKLEKSKLLKMHQMAPKQN